MARGDFTLFNEFLISIGEKKINLETDTIKLGLINNDSGEPDATEADPRWTITYQGDEVSPIDGVEYIADGVTISGPELILAGAVATFDDDDSNLAIAQDAGGFTDAFWGILYSATAAAEQAIGYVELDGAISQVAGPININFNASGILTLTNV